MSQHDLQAGLIQVANCYNVIRGSEYKSLGKLLYLSVNIFLMIEMCKPELVIIDWS